MPVTTTPFVVSVPIPVNLCLGPATPPVQTDMSELKMCYLRTRTLVPEQNCDCYELPPIETGLIGRYASVATDGTSIFVSAYEEAFGDLVVGKINQDERIDWMWVDGVPVGAPIVGGPTGPRGGVELPGADVGRYTSLAVDGTGNLHVAYYGSDPGTLYYGLGKKRDDGTYGWETVRLDEAGDAGRWASISVDADGRPGIAYHVRYLNGLSQLRYIFASIAEPIGRAARRLLS